MVKQARESGLKVLVYSKNGKVRYYCLDCEVWAPEELEELQHPNKGFKGWFEGWEFVIKHSGHKIITVNKKWRKEKVERNVAN